MSKNKKLKIEAGKKPEIIGEKPSTTRNHHIFSISLILIISIAIYFNTFSSPFVFDDISSIADNYKIRDLSNFYDLSGTRYIGFLSFALNYKFGGLNVLGYHLVNLLIHITNGFLVYLLISLLLKTYRNSQNTQASWIALTAALLFISHPIQTQAVTYIVQRFTSLTALFYLLAVVCYLKWRLTSSEIKLRHLWYGWALLSTVFAMKTKEISFTLPFIIMLVEAIFFGHFTKRRWVTLIPFLFTLLIIPTTHIDAGIADENVDFGQETANISRLDYLFTQFRVIVTYIRLLILPINQNMDYDYQIYHSFFETEVFLSFLFLLSIFVFAIYLYTRSRTTYNAHGILASFGIFYFFITLSVESSVIPIRDVIFEHRLYLPSIGIIIVFTSAAFYGFDYAGKKIGIKFSLFLATCILLLATVFPLGIAAYQRNKVWRDELSLWMDVVSKSPDKARGHHNLGKAYNNQGQIDKAIKEYLIGLKFAPWSDITHNNLGYAYGKQGRLNEAIEEFQIALRLNPDHVEAHYNLGNAYEKQGQHDKAIKEYKLALTYKPDYTEAHYNLGNVYLDQGHLNEAIEEFQIALKLNPDYVKAHYNLGYAYGKQGRLNEAIEEFQIALRLNPDYVEAHNNLGYAYGKQGRLNEAIEEFQIALRLNPDYVEAHYNLGNAYVKQGRWDDARKEFETVLRLKPDDKYAYQFLEYLRR